MTAGTYIMFMFFALILVGCGFIAQAAMHNAMAAQTRKDKSSWRL
jgi:hypothetical protein